MLDLVPGARVDGEIIYRDKNLYDAQVDPVEVRRRIGMVFQKPNPFPKSIYRQRRLWSTSARCQKEGHSGRDC